MDWSHQYNLWRTALDENRRADAHAIMDECQKCIPKEKSVDRWDWFNDALSDSETADFVLDLFSRHPIPRKMMSAFLVAGIRFGNAGSIKYFVIPCIETFGVDAVSNWFKETGPSLGLENYPARHRQAEYWFDYEHITMRY